MRQYAIEHDAVLADERPHTLGRRVEAVLAALAAATGAPCLTCATPLCAHDALASLVLGFQREPRCTRCLATEISRDEQVLREELASYVLSKECLTVGWRWANAREPRCSWLRDGTSVGRVEHTSRTSGPTQHADDVGPTTDTHWDAGTLACGELLLELRLRLRAMTPGSVIHVTALDTAAPEDMPAWCKLTGHALVNAKHPIYCIRKKED